MIGPHKVCCKCKDRIYYAPADNHDQDHPDDEEENPSPEPAKNKKDVMFG